MEKIARLIEGASRLDPEVGAGLATTENMTTIQRKIDQASAATESLCRSLRVAERELPDA
jgi:hypothetical protein